MHIWLIDTKGSPKASTAATHANPRTCPGCSKHILSAPKGSVGGSPTGASSGASSVVTRWNVTYLQQ